MAGINKVILVGNLGNDPDVRTTASGSVVASLSVATSESWTDKNTGQRQTKTEWHRVVMFGKTAEIAQQYLRKGSKVYIEGKLQTRKWTNQQGQEQHSTEIVVDGFGGQLQMLDSRNDQQQPQNQAQPQQQYGQQPQQQQYGQQPYGQQQNAYAQARTGAAPQQPQQYGQQPQPQHGQQQQQGPNDDIPF